MDSSDEVERTLAADPSREPSDRVASVDRLLRRGVRDLHPIVEGWLDERDEFLFGEALRVLVGRLHDDRYVPRALEMLRGGDRPDSDVLAMTCAGALADYVRETGKERRSVLSELVEALRRTGDSEVKRALYEACLQIVENDPFPRIPKDFVPDRDIDWERLE